jgi:hypothetical protein
MADVKVALEELKEESDSGKLAAPAAPAKRGRWWRLRWPAAAGALLLAGALWLYVSHTGRRIGPASRVIPVTSFPGVEQTPAFSPDGRFIAEAQPKRLTLGNWAVGGIAWTPDSSEIIFASRQEGDSSLWRIAASGSSTPERLAGVGLSSRPAQAAQEPGREGDDSPEQIEHPADGNPQDPKGKQQQPDQRVQDYGQQRQRPAKHQQNAPEQKGKHGSSSLRRDVSRKDAKQ